MATNCNKRHKNFYIEENNMNSCQAIVPRHDGHQKCAQREYQCKDLPNKSIKVLQAL